MLASLERHANAVRAASVWQDTSRVMAGRSEGVVVRRAVDLAGDTALHESAGGGHEPATRTLLAGRADPDASGQEGETPLIRAARRGHAGVVEASSPATVHAC